MSIYVVRHGQTDYNVKRLYQGRKDIPLNEIGKKQAMEMAEKFMDIKIDKIFVSPLTRAKQTAECISKITGVLPEIEDGLKERSFGEMEGKANNERCNIEMLLDYEKNYDIYNVEPIQEFFERVAVCLRKIIEENKEKNIVLVTHAGVTQAIEFYFKGMPANKDIESLALKNCEIRKYNSPFGDGS